MKRLVQWIAALLAEHVVLQFIAVPPLAYFLGLAAEAWQGAKTMFDSLPPLFWPMLAGLVLAVTFYPGFVSPRIKWRRSKMKEYTQALEQTYFNVSQAHRPQILNPAHRGNPHAIKQNAQDAVDALRPKLMRKYKKRDVPAMIDMDDVVSVRQWYEYLREKRATLDG